MSARDEVNLLLFGGQHEEIIAKLEERDALAEVLAWQLALSGRLDANPDWDPKDPVREGVLLCTVWLANGTAEGVRLEATGSTSNEVYRAMADRILEHYRKKES